MSHTALAPVYAVWKSVQLYVAFHKDRRGKRRSDPYLWPPKFANASIADDPGAQETFAVVKSSDGRDAQVKFRQDKVVLRRDPGVAWEGVLIGQDDVCVRVGGAWIKVAADGSVSRHTDNELAILEADGSILRKTEYEEYTVSADGGTMARRSANRTDAITPNGTVMRLKGDGDG
jgi:hypothetical protein